VNVERPQRLALSLKSPNLNGNVRVRAPLPARLVARRVGGILTITHIPESQAHDAPASHVTYG